MEQNKAIEVAKVCGINEMETKDGTKLLQVTAFTSKGTACVFYRPATEETKIDDMYGFYLAYDSKLKPYIKIVKGNTQ